MSQSMSDTTTSSSMSDALLGTRNKRGDWAPNERVTGSPLFEWPLKPAAAAKWFAGFPGYLWPWNLLYAALAFGAWSVAAPSMQTAKHFAPGWIGLVFVRNALLICVVFGIAHLRLYSKQAQGTQFKYNSRFLAKDGKQFTFGTQLRDNVFWTLVSGLPMMTAYEVVTLWLFANGHIGFLKWSQNPIWFVALFVLIPFFRDVHFHFVHRFLHWAPMYKVAHSLHHRNHNPGPWSGLSMHPIEHLMYFSGVLVHWIIPSHPVHAIFQLLHAGLSPVLGHTGFHRVEIGEKGGFNTNGQAHYLHHKYFEVNYSDGMIPFDKWLGSFHDGSPEGDALMAARRAKRPQKTSTNA
jgi:sterol desaturase/sphingolipid hydroxylase (fatty acid hydroxylase superfamily)